MKRFLQLQLLIFITMEKLYSEEINNSIIFIELIKVLIEIQI